MELVRRSAWGAAPPRSKPITIATPVKDLFLHHSAGRDNGPTTVRAIQKFHQDTRGWNDIAYSWLYSPNDRVFFEGRGPAVHGAHTRGHNSTAHGLCVLGNFEATVVPHHVVADLAEWAQWHGNTWGPSVYRPHNDVSSTLCPGKHLAALIPKINAYMVPAVPDVTTPTELPPTLRLGAVGDDVKLMQAAVMPHHGLFDRPTEDALKAFQRANGLVADGICGPKTWSTILGR